MPFATPQLSFPKVKTLIKRDLRAAKPLQVKDKNGPANQHCDQRMGSVNFNDVRSNAIQEQPHLLVFFESVPSAATKQTFSKRLFFSRAAIFWDTISDQ